MKDFIHHFGTEGASLIIREAASADNMRPKMKEMLSEIAEALEKGLKEYMEKNE